MAFVTLAISKMSAQKSLCNKFCLLLYAFILSSCSSPYGEIEGIVIDKLSEKQLAGVAVRLKGTAIQTLTDEKGVYKIKDVVPGVQKIIAEKKGYLLINEIELTIGKGTTSRPENIVLIQKPEQKGLYQIGESWHQLSEISEKSLKSTMSGATVVEHFSLQPLEDTVSNNIDMILYEGDNPTKVQGIFLIPLKYYPSESRQGLINTYIPSRWVSQEPLSKEISIERLNIQLSKITGTLSSGTYLVKVQHEMGVMDWFYIFKFMTPEDKAKAAAEAQEFAEQRKQALAKILADKRQAIGKGYQVYKDNKCDNCHKSKRGGTSDEGPNLLDIQTGIFSAARIKEDVVNPSKRIHSGFKDEKSKKAMPTYFGYDIVGRDMDLLIIFLKDQYNDKKMPVVGRAGKTKKWTDVPEMVAYGKKVFEGIENEDINCSVCHGKDGTPVMQGAGEFKNPNWLSNRIKKPYKEFTDADLFESVMYGVPGTPMMAWSEFGLTKEQAWGAIAYIRATFQNGFRK